VLSASFAASFRFVDFNVSRSQAASTVSRRAESALRFFSIASYVTFFSPRTSSKNYIESAFWVVRGKKSLYNSDRAKSSSTKLLRLCTPGELVRSERNSARPEVGFGSMWPISSALNIYGIYYLENRRKQAKIQGNIHSGTVDDST
jgi:hypothetical protein